MKKKGLQISFGWLFALIVGAFILFLAIFFVSKLMGTEQEVVTAKTGKEIGILLNPLETGFETGKSSSFSVPVETRLNNKCNTFGYFGTQKLQVSQQSFNKWSETDLDIIFYNKYIFSKDIVEGKNFYLFSKPFRFPFKVSDLIYMTSSNDKYCFIDAPEDIREELEDFNLENFLLEDCADRKDVVKVCFGVGACDVEVNIDSGVVRKRGKSVNFVVLESEFGKKDYSLMYAGIFADAEIYECQLQRLMLRTANLALIYSKKSDLITGVGCHSSNLNLVGLSASANSLKDSSSIGIVNVLAKNIQDKNADNRECRLW